MKMNLADGSTMTDVRRWIDATGRELRQPSTYIHYDGNVPHASRVRYGYRHIGMWQSGDIQVDIYQMAASNPQCYYLHFGPEVKLPPDDRFNAFIDARTVLAFLVHFEFELEHSLIRQSWRNCIPERERDTDDHRPLWFTPITVGYQTIWYTTLMPGQLYMERLLWRGEGERPLVEDYKYFEDVGWRVRELYE